MVKIKAGTPKWVQITLISCVLPQISFFFLIFGVENAWLEADSHDLGQIDTIRGEFKTHLGAKTLNLGHKHIGPWSKVYTMHKVYYYIYGIYHIRVYTMYKVFLFFLSSNKPNNGTLRAT